MLSVTSLVPSRLHPKLDRGNGTRAPKAPPDKSRYDILNRIVDVCNPPLPRLRCHPASYLSRVRSSLIFLAHSALASFRLFVHPAFWQQITTYPMSHQDIIPSLRLTLLDSHIFVFVPISVAPPRSCFLHTSPWPPALAPH